MISIVECLQDKNLFGKFIQDLATWRAWLTFFRAFFALPAKDGDLKLFEECTGRSKWPKKAASEGWLAIGTRGGKSFNIALLAAYLAVFREYNLSYGEKGYIVIIAPTKKQSGIIKSYISSFFQENPYLKPYFLNENTEDIELTNHIVITILSSNYRSIRGYTAVAAIVDEVAYLMIEGSRPDTEVIRALRSRLISTGGPLIAISSPYAKKGTLYETYRRHFGKNDSSILVWQASSQTMNPILKSEKISQAYEEDPEGAKADYGAQFRSNVEDFVTREAYEACISPGRYELPYIPDVRYSAFTDPSGGSSDSMTLGIGHEERGLKIVDALREKKPPFSPDGVVKEFSDLLKAYKVNSVCGDRYGGEWPRERFTVHGINYELCDKSKSDLYQSALPDINSGRCELLDNNKLTTQFINLERRVGRSGKDSIDHPPRGHDDLCNSAAGLLYMLSGSIAAASSGDDFPELSHTPTMGFRIGTRLGLVGRKQIKEKEYM